MRTGRKARHGIGNARNTKLFYTRISSHLYTSTMRTVSELSLQTKKGREMANLLVVRAYRNQPGHELLALVPFNAASEVPDQILVDEAKRRLESSFSARELETLLFKVEHTGQTCSRTPSP